MSIDPKSVPLLLPTGRKPLLTAAHVKAHARQRNAKRLAEVDRFVDTLFGPVKSKSYNPDALASMSELETSAWDSPIWQARLNPGGIGVTDGADDGIGFANGEQAAWAMTVHLMAYAKGFDNRLAQYIHLDPRFLEVHKAGFAKKAATLAGLGHGKWASDELYSVKAAGRLADMLDAIQTPKPTPQPTSDGAPLPSGIVQVATGNSHARFFNRQPVAIVYHITDDMSVENVISWFQNPSSQASSHVVIDRDGTIYQFVSSTRASWTNGDYVQGGQIVARRDIPLLWRCVQAVENAGGNFNDFTLNIEHVGTPEQPPTDVQYQRSIEISAYWRDRYSIKPSRGTCWRHADVNSVNRPYCPGPRFDLARIITALGGDPADMGS